jgi:hypothetical protein
MCANGGHRARGMQWWAPGKGTSPQEPSSELAAESKLGAIGICGGGRRGGGDALLVADTEGHPCLQGGVTARDSLRDGGSEVGRRSRTVHPRTSITQVPSSSVAVLTKLKAAGFMHPNTRVLPRGNACVCDGTVRSNGYERHTWSGAAAGRSNGDGVRAGWRAAVRVHARGIVDSCCRVVVDRCGIYAAVNPAASSIIDGWQRWRTGRRLTRRRCRQRCDRRYK